MNCRCGHNKMSHEVEAAPACVHAACGCTAYRTTSDGPTLEQILAAGKRSERTRTVKLVEKILMEIKDLHGLLTDEREAAEQKRQHDAEQEQTRADVERLAAELAAAKAKLTGRTPPRSTSTTKAGGTGVCPDCGKTGLSNVGVHRHRAHAAKAS